MNAVKASILVPTYNRCETLRRVLDAILQQARGLPGVEIVVSDDGSTDGTREFMARYGAPDCCPVVSVRSDQNHGPAFTRNRALERARGDLIIITGDDMVPDAGWLQGHLEWHRAHPEESYALLGHATWPDDPPPTPFMRWLEQGGRVFYFNYADMIDGQQVSPLSFYTCNVSLKRTLLNKAGVFNETYPFASHEDLELGWRLGGQGMRLFYSRGICVRHLHELTLGATLKRVYRMGYSATAFFKMVDDRPGFLKHALRYLLARLGATGLAHGLVPRLARAVTTPRGWHPIRWYLLLQLAFWCGRGDSCRGVNARSFNANYQWADAAS